VENGEKGGPPKKTAHQILEDMSSYTAYLEVKEEKPFKLTRNKVSSGDRVR